MKEPETTANDSLQPNAEQLFPTSMPNQSFCRSDGRLSKRFEHWELKLQLRLPLLPPHSLWHSQGRSSTQDLESLMTLGVSTILLLSLRSFHKWSFQPSSSKGPTEQPASSNKKCEKVGQTSKERRRTSKTTFSTSFPNCRPEAKFSEWPKSRTQ